MTDCVVRINPDVVAHFSDFLAQHDVLTHKVASNGRIFTDVSELFATEFKLGVAVPEILDHGSINFEKTCAGFLCWKQACRRHGSIWIHKHIEFNFDITFVDYRHSDHRFGSEQDVYETSSIPRFVTVNKHHTVIALRVGQVKQFVAGHGQDAFIGQKHSIDIKVVFETQFDALTQAVDIVTVNSLIKCRSGNQYTSQKEISTIMYYYIVEILD